MVVATGLKCEIARLASRAATNGSEGIDDGSGCEEVIVRNGLEVARANESCVRAGQNIYVPVVGFKPIAASTAAIPGSASVGGRT